MTILLAATGAGVLLACIARAAEPDAKLAGFALRAEENFDAARKRFLTEPTNAVAAWEFGRACFDRAEFATNNAERAAIAEQGIAVCRKLVARDIGSAPAHYYLGMNLGQLARTKTLGALKIVDEMEREFKMARALDELFDFAGPDRNLGLLYFEAPSIGSIGSRSKARLHLERAVVLTPDFPENRLNLAEAYAKWSDRNGLRREFKSLEALWPQARTNFAGEGWAMSWLDWERRWGRIKEKFPDASRPVDSPKAREG